MTGTPGENKGNGKAGASPWLGVASVLGVVAMLAGFYAAFAPDPGAAPPQPAALETNAAVTALLAKAEAGDREAQTALGKMYREGEGVPQDYAAALKWYRKAANYEDGIAYASQLGLSELYADGHGVEKDDAEAYFWLLIAERSYPHFKYLLFRVAAKYTEHLNPEQITAVENRAREWKPAAKKN